jgi:hypothetical protein
MKDVQLWKNPQTCEINGIEKARFITFGVKGVTHIACRNGVVVDLRWSVSALFVVGYTYPVS